MPLGLLFWMLMVLWLFSFLYQTWGTVRPPWVLHSGNVLLFVLLFIIGWKVFGFVIQG